MRSMFSHHELELYDWIREANQPSHVGGLQLCRPSDNYCQQNTTDCMEASGTVIACDWLELMVGDTWANEGGKGGSLPWGPLRTLTFSCNFCFLTVLCSEILHRLVLTSSSLHNWRVVAGETLCYALFEIPCSCGVGWAKFGSNLSRTSWSNMTFDKGSDRNL